MWNVARLLLMWLLAVAFPLQGAAAATMVACGVVSSFPSTVLENAPEAHDENAEAAGHMHEHQAHEAGRAHADAESASRDRAHSAHAHAHKCSACASCCFNAAVPAASLSIEALKSPDFFAPFVARTPPAFVGDGLERPPRPLLA